MMMNKIKMTENSVTKQSTEWQSQPTLKSIESQFPSSTKPSNLKVETVGSQPGFKMVYGGSSVKFKTRPPFKPPMANNLKMSAAQSSRSGFKTPFQMGSFGRKQIPQRASVAIKATLMDFDVSTDQGSEIDMLSSQPRNDEPIVINDISEK